MVPHDMKRVSETKFLSSSRWRDTRPMPSIANKTFLGNISGSSSVPSALTGDLLRMQPVTTTGAMNANSAVFSVKNNFIEGIIGMGGNMYGYCTVASASGSSFAYSNIDSTFRSIHQRRRYDSRYL
jgi:hypothetical protein